MEYEEISLEQLKPAERNVRIHPQGQIEEYAKSLSLFGQTRPAVVDEEGRILVGNGLYCAMKHLGRPSMYCVRKTGLTEIEKKKLMLADNKIFTLGLDYSDMQFQFIMEMGDTDIPGYDPSVLSTIIESSAESVNDRISIYGALEESQITRRAASEHDTAGSTSAPGEVSASGRNVVCPSCGKEFWTNVTSK